MRKIMSAAGSVFQLVDQFFQHLRDLIVVTAIDLFEFKEETERSINKYMSERSEGSWDMKRSDDFLIYGWCGILLILILLKLAAVYIPFFKYVILVVLVGYFIKKILDNFLKNWRKS